MCVPTKVETFWVILDTDNQNIIANQPYIHNALKPLEYIQTIVSKIVWARPMKGFFSIWAKATELGFIEDEAQSKIDIMPSQDELTTYLSSKIDLVYVPEFLGGVREGGLLVWPPDFPQLEKNRQQLDLDLCFKLDIPLFYFPIDKEKFESKRNCYNEIQGLNSSKVSHTSSEVSHNSKKKKSKTICYSRLQDKDNIRLFNEEVFEMNNIRGNETILNRIYYTKSNVSKDIKDTKKRSSAKGKRYSYKGEIVKGVSMFGKKSKKNEINDKNGEVEGEVHNVSRLSWRTLWMGGSDGLMGCCQGK